VKQLKRGVEALRLSHPDVEVPASYGRPRRLYEFDDQYTSRMTGFGSAAEYYLRCSAGQFLHQIEVPTLILTARDDPLVPVSSFDGVRLSPASRLHIAEGGGHLGYIAARSDDPDRRWMDWRVVEWLTHDAS
jgi:predicted alpha/beta-fold hydrolase